MKYRNERHDLGDERKHKNVEAVEQREMHTYGIGGFSLSPVEVQLLPALTESCTAQGPFLFTVAWIQSKAITLNH